MTLALLERLASHAVHQGARAAVREVGPGARTTLSYAQLHEQVRAASAAIARHICPGDVVLIVTGNRAEFFTGALAAWTAGAALMPMHPTVASAELASTIHRTNAKLLLTGRDISLPASIATLPLARSGAGIPPVQEDPSCLAGQAERENPQRSASAALLLQSSGTTGLPKIAWRPSPAIDAVARNTAEATGLTPEDRVFAAIPICHAYGIENGFLAAIWAGATVHLCDGLDLQTAMQQLRGTPELSEDSSEPPGRATIFPGVPFMFEVLATQSNPQSTIRNPQSLRLAYSAGAPLPFQVSLAFTKAFGLQVGQLYGASELGSVTFGHPADPTFDPASAGRPMTGVRILILDQDDPDPAHPLPPGHEGQVAIHAPSMLARYVESEAPILSGFFLTGDLGRLDSGRLFITGRLKLLIDIGGTKVNPAEVELILKQHPAVAEAVVVPVPVTQTVSRLKAIVTARGSLPLDEADLRAFARERLAAFKVPRLIEVRQTLPRSPTGKILRRELEGAR